jgi:tRNA threonylcarbamoyladenosine biosynthesis protein TsaB
MPHAVQIATGGGGVCGRPHGAADAQPLYLRNKVAYTQAERREMAATKEAGA